MEYEILILVWYYGDGMLTLNYGYEVLKNMDVDFFNLFGIMGIFLGTQWIRIRMWIVNTDSICQYYVYRL